MCSVVLNTIQSLISPTQQEGFAVVKTRKINSTNRNNVFYNDPDLKLMKAQTFQNGWKHGFIWQKNPFLMELPMSLKL
jgi:hypothetical protein